MTHTSDKKIETQVWQRRPDGSGYLDLVRTKTVQEVYDEIREALGEYPHGCEEYFTVSLHVANSMEWPRGQIAVYPVVGSSEGHYIHVEVMGGGNFAESGPDGTFQRIFLGKTFSGWDAAWEFSKRLAWMLEELS